MLLFCGVLLFLPLIIPPPSGGGVNKDCLPIGPFFFLPLIIPPAVAGGIVKIAFLRGLSFFALNQPAPVGADKINIPRCRGG